jgi:hypothetical protein
MNNKQITTPNPFQLELFQLTIGNERYYSNTVEFWDVIPKFFYGRVSRTKVIDEKSKTIMHILPSLVRQMQYNKEGVTYTITVNPAIITSYDDKTQQYISVYHYPSTREELVEDVLRKLISSGHGRFIKNDVSVFFSLREIQQSLRQSGHTYSIVEIKEALDVMSKTHIEITSDGGDIEYHGNILIALALIKRGGGGTKCFCSLNPLVSNAIKQLKFRKYNYSKCIQYQMPISRYLHKRISHYYKQAGTDNCYTIKLSTLLNDSGHCMRKNITRNQDKIKAALDELTANDTVKRYTIEPIRTKNVKMKIVDYKIHIVPSENLMNDIVNANVREVKNNAFFLK